MIFERCEICGQKDCEAEANGTRCIDDEFEMPVTLTPAEWQKIIRRYCALSQKVSFLDSDLRQLDAECDAFCEVGYD